MRLLLDQNLPPRMADLLAAAGYDAIHLATLGLSRARDPDVLEHAADDHRHLVSADTDFGELLARTNASRPSVIILRRQNDRRAVSLAGLLTANLPVVATDLDSGAIVVLDADRIRIRRLPLQPDT